MALDTLLQYPGVRGVVLTGMAANICVLFTANDAYMRDPHRAVSSDCVASNTEEENRNALEKMRRVLKADTRVAAEVSFRDLTRRGG
jgi:nicotinamidase-related amidase